MSEETGAPRLLAMIRQRMSMLHEDPGKRRVWEFEPLSIPESYPRGLIEPGRVRWTLREMLAYHDRQFVQNAYTALLKRDPDVGGLLHSLKDIHDGRSTRVETLIKIRYASEEGKRHGVRVVGLKRAYLFERVARIPVLGWFARYLRALVFLPRLHSDLEELRNLTAMLKNDSDDKMQALVHFQNARFEELANLSGKQTDS